MEGLEECSLLSVNHADHPQFNLEVTTTKIFAIYYYWLSRKKRSLFEPSFFFHFSRGVCHRIDIGELSHPAMHKRLFHAGNAVDDENKS